MESQLTKSRALQLTSRRRQQQRSVQKLHTLSLNRDRRRKILLQILRGLATWFMNSSAAFLLLPCRLNLRDRKNCEETACCIWSQRRTNNSHHQVAIKKKKNALPHRCFIGLHATSECQLWEESSGGFFLDSTEVKRQCYQVDHQVPGVEHIPNLVQAQLARSSECRKRPCGYIRQGGMAKSQMSRNLRSERCLCRPCPHHGWIRRMTYFKHGTLASKLAPASGWSASDVVRGKSGRFATAKREAAAQARCKPSLFRRTLLWRRGGLLVHPGSRPRAQRRTSRRCDGWAAKATALPPPGSDAGSFLAAVQASGLSLFLCVCSLSFTFK